MLKWPETSSAALFGVKFRIWRISKGISQTKIARAAGLSNTYVGHVEMGKKLPFNDDVIHRIMGGLKMDEAAGYWISIARWDRGIRAIQCDGAVAKKLSAIAEVVADSGDTAEFWDQIQAVVNKARKVKRHGNS